MKKNLTLFVCLLSFYCSILMVTAQSPKAVLVSNSNTELDSSTEIPKRLVRKFRRDAARLVLRMEAEKEDLRYLNINIPKSSIDNIYKILTKIYLTDDKAKSIADCNIHTFPDPSIDHFVLIFDRDIEWAEPLRSGITETDSEEINDLLNTYDLVIEKHVQWNDAQDAITIRSADPLNMAALANEFYNVDGVAEIDFGLPKAGGNDIRLRPVPGGSWEVQYILKFGSYINGNGKTHSWIYQFDKAGDVKFISETGDEVPGWMRCEIENAFKRI